MILPDEAVGLWPFGASSNLPRNQTIFINCNKSPVERFSHKPVWLRNSKALHCILTHTRNDQY